MRATAAALALRLRRRPGVIVALGLMGALAVVYANVVFLGRSLVATENYNAMRMPPGEVSYGPGFVPHSEWHRRGLWLWAGQYDPAAAWQIWEPGAHFLRRTLAGGELPFWNPYVGAGAPGLANLSETHLFPPYLALVLLGAGSLAKNAYALGLLLSAGVFTYLFLRRHELSHPAAAFGGLLFMLSGALNQMIVSLGGQTVACLPFTLYLTRVFLDRPDARRLALLATGYAAVSLSSSPPLLLLGFGYTAAYALAAIAGEPACAPAAGRVALLLRYVAAAALALGLVAFYYVPMAELVTLSWYVRSLYSGAARQAFPVSTLLQLLSPDLFGGGAVYAVPPVRDPIPWHVQACGVTALFAALLAGRGGPVRRSGLFLFAALSGLFVAAKVVGFWPLQRLFELPLLRNVHFAVYCSFLMHFSAAALAAIGWERLRNGELPRWRPVAAWLALGAALVTVFVLARGLGLELRARPSPYNWAYRYAAVWLANTGLLVAALVALRARARPRAAQLACLAIFGIALCEGVLDLSFPRQRRFDPWRHPVPHVQALARLQDGRRFVDYRALPANTQVAFGIFGLDSLSTFNAGRVAEVHQRFFGSPRQQFLREISQFPAEPLLDRAGVGFLVVRNEFPDWLDEAARRGYSLQHRDEYASVFSRDGGQRYLVTPSYRVLPERAALDQLAAAPSSELLLEQAPSFPPRGLDPSARVDVISFRNNSFSLTVESPGPALLYCAESHMPGWQATVDGHPVPILAANYAFRAVEVPKGRSQVSFRYVPPGLATGLLVTVPSLLLLVALLWPRRAGAAVLPA